MRKFGFVWLAGVFALTAFVLQRVAAAQTVAPQAAPIAIVPIDNKNPDQAATVTGALEVTGGKAIIAVSGSVTATGQTTRVILPHRGELHVCASTTVKLAADSSVASGDAPGLLMAMDHGAVEISFAAGAASLRNADVLLTPDFRILISGPGAAEVKVRLGSQGDTCVDNAGVPGDGASQTGLNPQVNAPYVLVSSVFDGGAYRVQPGQRVMFQHGSLHVVVNQEKESCGCPPGAPKGNEFPEAQSAGLAPMPKPAPGSLGNAPDLAVVEPLVYKGADPTARLTEAAKDGAGSTAVAAAAQTPPEQKKAGFFKRVGRFFRRIFGAE
ncbi:MAG: hypothetical protein P4M04_09935 [Acidobacteriota bacterium]|nr:hypothetical protein [Acidobacteriota bacterium]